MGAELKLKSSISADSEVRLERSVRNDGKTTNANIIVSNRSDSFFTRKHNEGMSKENVMRSRVAAMNQATGEEAMPGNDRQATAAPFWDSVGKHSSDTSGDFFNIPFDDYIAYSVMNSPSVFMEDIEDAINTLDETESSSDSHDYFTNNLNSLETESTVASNDWIADSNGDSNYGSYHHVAAALASNTENADAGSHQIEMSQTENPTNLPDGSADENHSSDDDAKDDLEMSLLDIANLSHQSTQLIPGPFVVMQGSPGDGMANTIDSMPVLSRSILLGLARTGSGPLGSGSENDPMRSSSFGSDGGMESNASNQNDPGSNGNGGGNNGNGNGNGREGLVRSTSVRSLQERIPSMVLEELGDDEIEDADNVASFEHADGDSKNGDTMFGLGSEQSQKNTDVGQVHNGGEAESSVPSISESSGSETVSANHQDDREEMLATPRSPLSQRWQVQRDAHQHPTTNTSSSTEGGLHLPLGPASPIMQRMQTSLLGNYQRHHGDMLTGKAGAGTSSGDSNRAGLAGSLSPKANTETTTQSTASNAPTLADAGTIDDIIPSLPIYNNEENEEDGHSHDTAPPLSFLKRRPVGPITPRPSKVQSTTGTPPSVSQAAAAAASSERIAESEEGKEEAKDDSSSPLAPIETMDQSENRDDQRAAISTQLDETPRQSNLNAPLQNTPQSPISAPYQRHNPNDNKSHAEREAIHRWHAECREHELSNLEETQQNVKLLLQRRKREREVRLARMNSAMTPAGRAALARVTSAGASGDIRARDEAVEEMVRSGEEEVSPDRREQRRNVRRQQLLQMLQLTSSSSSSSRGGAGESNNESADDAASSGADGSRDAPDVEDEADEIDSIIDHHRSWYQVDGHLVVLTCLPHMSLQGVLVRPLTSENGTVCTLAPGCTVMAVEAFSLEWRTLRHIPIETSSSTGSNGSPSSQTQHKKAKRTMQILKIESPYEGYVVSKVNGYSYIAPGLPSTYANASEWSWRVTCQPDGAFVRKGLELITSHVDTMPYGSFCKVTKKAVNSMGLNRLNIESFLTKKKEGDNETNGANGNENNGEAEALGMTKVSGWISEFLNPLSGQRGPVVVPVPFPVPAIYRVIHQDGCVIRSGVELSTSQIGHAPYGSELSIVGRAFSDHPRDQCIERLRLAGGGGWISAHLNRSHPENHKLVEMIGVDGTFDPDDPASFHFEAQRKVMQELGSSSRRSSMRSDSGGANDDLRNRTSRRSLLGADLSEINDDEDRQSCFSDDDTQTMPLGMTSSNAAVPTLFRSGVVQGSSTTAGIGAESMMRGGASSLDPQHLSHSNRCLICLSDERTATIVHGETGHIACCLTCSRILKARGDNCPVCRLPIDLVIQHFWA